MSHNIEFGGGPDQVKRMELSGNIISGLMFSKHILLSVNYNAGLSRVFNSQAPEEGKVTNNYFGIQLGYLLKGKRR